MLKAGEMYGNIPAGKGEDDGSVFSTFLKESKYPKDLRSVNWEDIRDILEKYKVRHSSVWVKNLLIYASFSSTLVHAFCSKRSPDGSIPAGSFRRTAAPSVCYRERVYNGHEGEVTRFISICFNLVVRNF